MTQLPYKNSVTHYRYLFAREILAHHVRAERHDDGAEHRPEDGDDDDGSGVLRRRGVEGGARQDAEAVVRSVQLPSQVGTGADSVGAAHAVVAVEGAERDSRFIWGL